MRYTTRFNDIPVSVTLAADPALDDRQLDATTRLSSPKSGTYADDSYEYSCTETPLGPKSLLLKLQLRRVDGSPFKVTAFKAEAAVPGLDLHRVFVPVLHEAIGKRDLISLPWGVEERTFTSWSFPFIAALNRFDQNRFCMGFMDHVHAADTRHSCYDEDANMSLQRLFDPAPRETSVWEETLYMSCEDRPIFDEVRAFSRAYDELHKVALPPAPPSVWKPVWCSWYGIKNDVDADYIRSMVPLLKEWGIGNIIVDAGWFKGDGFDLDTGHYIPDETKFPDLKGLVEEVQSEGLTILLWCAPLFNISDLAGVPFIQKHRFPIRRLRRSGQLPLSPLPCGAPIRLSHGQTPDADLRLQRPQDRLHRPAARPRQPPLHHRPRARYRRLRRGRPRPAPRHLPSCHASARRRPARIPHELLNPCHPALCHQPPRPGRALRPRPHPPYVYSAQKLHPQPGSRPRGQRGCTHRPSLLATRGKPRKRRSLHG